MKLMSKTATPDRTSELRELLEQHKAVTAEIKRTRDKGEERQRSRAALIDSGDEGKAGEILALGVQIQMIEPAIKRLEARAAELAEPIKQQAGFLNSSMRTTVETALRAGEGHVVKTLCPLFNADPASPPMNVRGFAERIFAEMPVYQIIAGAMPSNLRDGGDVIAQAESVLYSCERLTHQLKQAAPFLPADFNPFA